MLRRKSKPAAVQPEDARNEQAKKSSALLHGMSDSSNKQMGRNDLGTTNMSNTQKLGVWAALKGDLSQDH